MTSSNAAPPVQHMSFLKITFRDQEFTNIIHNVRIKMLAPSFKGLDVPTEIGRTFTGAHRSSFGQMPSLLPSMTPIWVSVGVEPLSHGCSLVYIIYHISKYNISTVKSVLGKKHSNIRPT